MGLGAAVVEWGARGKGEAKLWWRQRGSGGPSEGSEALGGDEQGESCQANGGWRWGPSDAGCGEAVREQGRIRGGDCANPGQNLVPGVGHSVQGARAKSIPVHVPAGGWQEESHHGRSMGVWGRSAGGV